MNTYLIFRCYTLNKQITVVFKICKIEYNNNDITHKNLTENQMQSNMKILLVNIL